MMRGSVATVAVVGLWIFAGCASSPESAAPAAPPAPAPAAAPAATPGAAPAAATPTPAAGGVTYREDQPLGGRGWAAPGLDANAYDTLYLAPVVAQVAKLNPDGVENLEWAKGVLRDEVAAALRASSLFAAVVTSEAEIKPGSRTLRFEHTIVEYEKGGGGARFFAGLYGAGQPVLEVQGRLTGEGAGQPLFLYEARRSGDSGTSRLFGGYRSDKDIQLDIKDLARDLADYMARTIKK
jgi:hypothetical protein